MDKNQTTDRELNKFVHEQLQILCDLGMSKYIDAEDKKSYEAGLGLGQMIGTFLILYELKKKYGIDYE
ncbi:hypothetical protein [Bacillus sp. 3255]|uniref:hypothetical protein n=1 Tax=Bacillus sp. 3255 TaxID=2817904 RepID=UPI002861A0DC|nr:hypothetical protein [Bacillus sp. 3255]MDR6883046.1 hypothetical protein [Bacillus sp. 3255]